MSELHSTPTAAETPATEPLTTQQPEVVSEEVPKEEPTTALPATEPSKTEETTDVAAETHDEITPVEGKKDKTAPSVETKSVDPYTEGQLTLKGPGLLKSIIPSKKEFWLSDDAVSPQDLNSYMRGEKPEVAHPVVAWASQTGKGLLFFNKKGETTRRQPGHVLALYDATDLKVESPHDISFRLNSQELVLKATSDAERDGWYISLEKAVEMGKSMKEEISESEGYKAEMEKLNKPNVAAGGATAAGAAAKRSQSQPKKSVEAEKTHTPERKNSEAAEDVKKDTKSRSASRGVLSRLKSKKDDLETKKEEKEEKKAETEAAKPEEENKTEEAAVAGATGLTGIAAAEGIAHGNKEETPVTLADEKKDDKAVKSGKRGSIFGKWGNMMSPTKEKDQKDAELKPEVPLKDNAVSENPPQLPETTTTEPSEPIVELSRVDTETKPEGIDEKKEVMTPGKEKKNFLSGLPFMNKRGRSVSPSANMKEAPVKTEEAAKEPGIVGEVKNDEAVTDVSAVEPLKPAAEEPVKENEPVNGTTPAETTPAKEATPNKRESVITTLGRRASKAIRGMQTPKKENAAPITAAKKDLTSETTPVTWEPITNGETNTTTSKPEEPHQIGDVVPEAISIGSPEHQPAAVASAA